MDDQRLLAAWAAGDASAGEALFELHFNAVCRFFANKAPQAVEDLVQQTFLACLESAGRFRGASTVRTWLLGIANNVLRSHYAAGARAPVAFGTASVQDLAPSLSRVMDRAQTENALLVALRRLPLELQITVELYFWENMSGTEIAAALELPEGTVRSRIRRARDLLQEQLGSSDAERRVSETRDDLERWSAELRARSRVAAAGD